MSFRAALRHAAPALVLGLAAHAPTAQALNIVVTDTGLTPMTAVQFAAVQSAAAYWSNKLTDNVTVYLNVSFADLGGNTLGTTIANLTTINYSTLRSRLTSDATSATDTSAVASLPSGQSVSFKATQGDLSTRLDNDGSTNNKVLNLTTANYKALGLSVETSPGLPDARISFSNAFASQFAYTRVNGQVPADKLDFITVAEHEIAHALGFLSGVDSIDFCVDRPSSCGVSATVDRFEAGVWYYPLDMFRYSSAGQRDVTVGGSPYLSVNGGVTQVQSFSTGEAHGNGQQASHFGTGALTLMKPSLTAGQSYDATASDLIALDAIGWNLAVTAVPEPASFALLAAGLATLGLRRRRLRG